MSQFELRTVEYNGEERTELVGMAKLIGLPSEKEFEYTNGSGETKSYRLATIEITTPSGAVSQTSTQIHQRNQELMQESGEEFRIGTSYLTTLRAGKDTGGNVRIFATTSHLVTTLMSSEVTNELAAMLGETTTNNQPEVELKTEA